MIKLKTYSTDNISLHGTTVLIKIERIVSVYLSFDNHLSNIFTVIRCMPSCCKGDAELYYVMETPDEIDNILWLYSRLKSGKIRNER